MTPDHTASQTVTRPGASCALWWDGAIPALPGERLGIVGAYVCDDPRAARPLLDDACARLREQGCTLAIGPMDGNTWRRYRFVTESVPDQPPFFLEPTNPPQYPAQWTDAGFAPYATYRSTVTEDLGATDPRAGRIARKMADAGIALRTVDRSRIEDDLGAIYDLSRVAFAHNLLYTPLERDAFLGQYRQILPAVDPALTVLAHAPDATLIGFLFAIPDLSERQRGEAVRTVVVKTAAVLPGRAWAGLGVHLLERCHAAARERGYSRAIHALMHDSNTSRTISEAHGARTIRRYTLFARRLTP